MTAEPTFYGFRRRTAQALLATVAFAVFAFGAVDVWAYTIVAAAILSLLAIWAVKKSFDPFPVVSTSLYYPLALLPGVAVIQLLLGATQAPYATTGALLDWLLYLSFFFLAVNVLADASIRRWFHQGVLWTVAVAALIGIAQWLTSPASVYWFRVVPGAHPFGPFANADHFVVLVELAFPIALMQALRRRSRKHYYFTGCTVMTIAVAGAGSALGLAIIAVQFVVLVATVSGATFRSALLSRRRGPSFVFGLLGAGGLAALLLVASWSIGALRIGAADLEPAQAVLDRNAALLTRANVLEASLSLIEQRPMLGHGLGSFGKVLARVAPSRDGWLWTHAQCDPLELGVEAGLFGLAAQGLLLILLLLRFRSINFLGLVAAPLAGAWAHSWYSTPIQTPAVVLTALALLGSAPGLTERVAVRRDRRVKRTPAPQTDALQPDAAGSVAVEAGTQKPRAHPRRRERR